MSLPHRIGWAWSFSKALFCCLTLYVWTEVSLATYTQRSWFILMWKHQIDATHLPFIQNSVVVIWWLRPSIKNGLFSTVLFRSKFSLCDSSMKAIFCEKTTSSREVLYLACSAFTLATQTSESETLNSSFTVAPLEVCVECAVRLMWAHMYLWTKNECGVWQYYV